MALAHLGRSARSRAPARAASSLRCRVNRKVTVPRRRRRSGSVIRARSSVSGGSASVSSRSRDGQPAQDRERDRRLARAGRPRSPTSRAPGTSSARRRRPGRCAAGRRGPTARRRSRRAQGVAIVSPSRTTRAPPLTTMKKPVPISPWRAITWSAGNSTSTATAAIRSIPAASTPANSRAADSSAVLRSRVRVIGSSGIGFSAAMLRRAARRASTAHRRASDAARAPYLAPCRHGRTRGADRRDRRVRAVRRPDPTRSSRASSTCSRRRSSARARRSSARA